MARLSAVRAELTRADRTAFVLVLIPERLPIEESARAAHQLADAGVHLGRPGRQPGAAGGGRGAVLPRPQGAGAGPPERDRSAGCRDARGCWCRNSSRTCTGWRAWSGSAATCWMNRQRAGRIRGGLCAAPARRSAEERMTKTRRQTLILELVDHEEITSQEMLQRRLRTRGVHATQATMSRDLKELGPREARRRRRLRPAGPGVDELPKPRSRSSSASSVRSLSRTAGWTNSSCCARRPARRSTSPSPSTARISRRSSARSPATTRSSSSRAAARQSAAFLEQLEKLSR